jgi:TorA maturation chaperone TorD
MAKKTENGKKGKVLDLNAKILISIRDELREHSSILKQHTSILEQHTSILLQHTSILNEHSQRLTSVENALKELARETRKWVASL